MFEIQNKSGQQLAYSVLVIDICVIRICLAQASLRVEFRYSNFEFFRTCLFGIKGYGG